MSLLFYSSKARNDASSLFKVGSFSKAATAGDQTITDIGFEPKALILWTSGANSTTAKTQADGDARTCFAVISGTAVADQFASSITLHTAGSGGRRISQKAFLLTDVEGTIVTDSALLSSFNADGFTLTWSVAAASVTIHYLAIGGSDVRAKVVTFTVPPTGTGNFSVTGVGFMPTALLFSGSVGPGTVLDQGVSSVFGHFGAAISPFSQWSCAYATGQTSGSEASRWHRNDRCIQRSAFAFSPLEVDHFSMDADGFTLNQITASDAGGNVVMAALALELPGGVAIGTFVKPTTATANTVVGLGFEPKAVLLMSDQDIERNNLSSTTGAGLGISAFETGGGGTSSVHFVPNNPGSVLFGYADRDKSATKMNATTPIQSEATSAITADGFTLTWDTADGEATEYAFIAFGDDLVPANYGHRFEGKLAGATGPWTDLTSDTLISPHAQLAYGIAGSGPVDLVERVSTLTFALNNSETNSAGIRGLYSPNGPNVRSGFARGIAIRYRYRPFGTNRFYTKFVGRLLNANPTSGVFGLRQTKCDAVGWSSEAANFALNVPAQVSKRADEVMRTVIESMPKAPGQLAFDIADSTFPYALDGRSSNPSLLTEIQRITQSEFGRYYLRGTLNQGGLVARFEKRSARLIPRPATFFHGTSTGLEVMVDLRNIVKVIVHPREVDATATVVLFVKPVTSNPAVNPGETIVITGRYSSASDRTTNVGGTDMVVPVSGTDFVMNSAADGSGSNLTASFAVTAGFSANQVEFSITNNGGTLGYVRTLQARGRGIYDFTPLEARGVNQVSIDNLGTELPVSLDMPYQADFATAQAIAQFLVDTWSTEGYATARLRFIPQDVVQLELAASLEPGTAIGISEAVTAVNDTFFIQDVEVTMLENRLAVYEFGLQRALVQDYWQLGVTDFSELGITTVLAPL